MYTNTRICPVDITSAAERELAAFLSAASKVVGQGTLSRASDIWIRIVETLDWSDENMDRFFRKVTLQAAAQLAAYAENETGSLHKVEPEKTPPYAANTLSLLASL